MRWINCPELDDGEEEETPEGEQEAEEDLSAQDPGIEGALETADEAEEVLADVAAAARRLTARGTPCARTWDDDWVAVVDEAEARLDRRICGARLLSGTPCTFESRHANGRCRFHGGFDLTGAQKGNRNAVLHGLYSRRLQACGEQCAQWRGCPCAGRDVLDVELKDRPICPYEQTEYNAVLTDALAKCEHQPHPDPLNKHYAHHVALLQVMTNRAAGAVRVQSLTDLLSVSSEQLQKREWKMASCLQAFLRLAGEYRAFIREFDRHLEHQARHGECECPNPKTLLRHDIRMALDTDLRPDAQALSQLPEVLSLQHADSYVRKAMRAAHDGLDGEVLEAMDKACELNPWTASKNVDYVIAAYRPEGGVLPKKVVQKVLEHMTGDPNLVSERDYEDEEGPSHPWRNRFNIGRAAVQRHLRPRRRR